METQVCAEDEEDEERLRRQVKELQDLAARKEQERKQVSESPVSRFGQVRRGERGRRRAVVNLSSS